MGRERESCAVSDDLWTVHKRVVEVVLLGTSRGERGVAKGEIRLLASQRGDEGPVSLLGGCLSDPAVSHDFGDLAR